MTFVVHAIAGDSLMSLRASGKDHSTAGGGEPLRCCLRDAVEGERIVLVNYEPELPESPYREVGAVFVHSADCAGYSGTGYPEGWVGRAQVLRAYDSRGWIHPSTTIHDGTDPVAVIESQLANPDVTQIHSRNIAYGCYMFTITRP